MPKGPPKCGCGLVMLALTNGGNPTPGAVKWCDHCDSFCGHMVDQQPLVGESDVQAWERQMAQSSRCSYCSTTRKTVRLIKRD